MPEIRFRIEWPDGAQELCYSPSLVVKDYFAPQQSYDLHDFLQRSTEALQIASDRVQAKYGMPCNLALGQIQKIQATAKRYQNVPEAKVKLLGFLEAAV
ncbi:MSMEG_0570 family nitrogen starvation response protein [Pseudanabaena sp. FACHB-2040]|uniref:MSMEG_0570 family nitrogen starvation response protein n=1 Tax=Pseudanabaena sp. FACHB-2040 TaxID=2692859 RepID=UPI0016877700|nr:MSMEG_0570 family nitrogen starvation response protein [Pseudanabaena sp. FACHB-2040]MBD0267920.1 MSMEG_0570 family nitrogen starvation response protein [Cyanobacteria bacterium Co-bin8]MBD2257558.1 MSMEG_0570 family nitrogen starvation response protein [Pseudanabaena sp. FACHB-2040]